MVMLVSSWDHLVLYCNCKQAGEQQNVLNHMYTQQNLVSAEFSLWILGYFSLSSIFIYERMCDKIQAVGERTRWGF